MKAVQCRLQIEEDSLATAGIPCHSWIKEAGFYNSAICITQAL